MPEVDIIKNLFEVAIKTEIGYAKSSTRTTKFLESIDTTKKDILILMAGDFGIACKNFVDLYDITHPHIEKVFYHLNGSLIVEFIDCLETLKNNYDKSGIVRVFRSYFSGNEIIASIWMGMRNTPIRLLKNREDRDFARSSLFYFNPFNPTNGYDLSRGTRLKPQVPTENYLSLKICNDNSVPASFSNFVRLAKPENNFVDKYTKLKDQLGVLGMKSQSDVYKNKLIELSQRISNSYCGFHRINLEEATAILAKVNGFSLNSAKPFIPKNDKRVGELFKLFIPSSGMGKTIGNIMGLVWRRTDTIGENLAVSYDYDEAAHTVLDSIAAKHKINLIEYQPRLYSLSHFTWSEELRAIINLLEKFPDFDSKPVFDDFCVVTTGFTFDNHCCDNDSGKHLLKVKGKLLEFKDKHEVHFFLDKYLIENKLMEAIIVGKKDDEYYFLTYL